MPKKRQRYKVKVGNRLCDAEKGERLAATPNPDAYIPVAEGLNIAADIYGEKGPLVLLQHGGGQRVHDGLRGRDPGRRGGMRRRRCAGGVPG